MSEIDDRIPGSADGVVGVPVADEMVLLHEPTQALHALDPVATILWQCFDGASSIAEIARDAAEAFGISHATAAADIGHLVDSLLGLGLVELAGDGGRAAGSPSVTDPTRLRNPPDP